MTRWPFSFTAYPLLHHYRDTTGGRGRRRPGVPPRGSALADIRGSQTCARGRVSPEISVPAAAQGSPTVATGRRSGAVSPRVATKTTAPATAPTWRNRITGSGEEAPDQLLANPANWRIHPKAQQDALAGALDPVRWSSDGVQNGPGSAPWRGGRRGAAKPCLDPVAKRRRRPPEFVGGPGGESYRHERRLSGRAIRAQPDPSRRPLGSREPRRDRITRASGRRRQLPACARRRRSAALAYGQCGSAPSPLPPQDEQAHDGDPGR
jgi:hypothetical protein